MKTQIQRGLAEVAALPAQSGKTRRAEGLSLSAGALMATLRPDQTCKKRWRQHERVGPDTNEAQGKQARCKSRSGKGSARKK